MEYLSLFKKYVMSNEAECKKLYSERLNSESSFHFAFKIGNNDAFFFYHPSICEKVSKIYKLNQEVNDAFLKLPKVAQDHYIKHCLIEEVQFSNEIEGVVSTRKEIDEIISSLRANKKAKENRLEGIVNSYLRLYEDINIDLNTSIDIRKIYNDLLLKEISDENSKNVPDGIIFRKEEVEVDNSDGTKIHSGIYPEEKIITYMDNALQILKNKDIDPIISASIFHYLFGYIHPFYDGNGRTSRFITSYLLSKCLCRISSFRISMTIKEKLSAYYKAFKETNDPRNFGDIGTFVNTMLDIIIDSQEKTILYVKEKNDAIDSIMRKIEGLKKSDKELNFLYILLQATLFKSDGISLNELVGVLKNNRKTILTYIGSNKEIIRTDKSNKEYKYSIIIEDFLF